jgi:4-amino-4-deoxy-L-arabinose transferase-like glycosyltransferase
MSREKFLRREKVLLLGLFVVALSIRLLIGLTSLNPELVADARTYDELAVSILQGQGLALGAYPTSIYMPLYPIFLASIYFLGGHNYFWVVILQAIISALMCVSIYSLAKRLFNERIAWLSGIFLCFNLALIFAPGSILSETLYSFLLLTAVLFLIKFVQDYKIRDILLAAALFGLATLTRPLIFLFPFLICIYLIKMLTRKFRLKVAVKTISLFMLVFLLPVGIWTMRNYRVHRVFIPLSSIGAETLYCSYTPKQGKIFGKFTFDRTFEDSPKARNEVERQKYYLNRSMQYIHSNLDKIPKLLLLKVMYFFSLFDWEIIGYGVYNFSFGFILPTMLVGLFTAFSITNDKSLWIIYLLLLYNFLVCLVFYASPRLRIPLEPYLILFSASGVYYIWQRCRYKLMVISILAGYLLINYLAYLYSSQIKGLFKGLFQSFGLW